MVQYIVSQNGTEERIKVETLGTELARVLVTFEDGTALKLDAHRVEPSCFSVIVDTKVYEFDVEVQNGDVELYFGNETLLVSVLNERQALLKQIQEKSADQVGESMLVAPMPGKVTAVLVAQGERVSKGQGLIVIEAMKMQNELKSPIDGVVVKLYVQEDQAIEGKAPLVLLGQEMPQA